MPLRLLWTCSQNEPFSNNMYVYTFLGLPGYFQSPVLQAPEDAAAGELSHEDALRRAIFRLSGLQVFIHGLGV